MSNNLLYLVSIFCFAGLAIALEWIFGFHLLKKYLSTIFLTTLLGLLLTPAESVALSFKAWAFSSTNTLNSKFLGAEIESYIFAVFTSLAVSSAVIAWTHYEDNGKNILKQSLIDILKGTYAIWKRKFAF